jgi:hypothetical protein
MAKQIINIGKSVNDKSGDPLRTAFTKVNENFTELYNAMGADIQIPAQANNAGKFLTTNGSTLSWGTVSTGTNTLGGLGDVSLGGAPADGESLVYNNTLGKWTNTIISSDRLVNGDLEATLDSKGTINTPLLLPRTFTAVLDAAHFTSGPELTLTNIPWEFVVEFQVGPDGTIQTMIGNNTPWFTNPGYADGYTFTYTEADHGIPGYTFTLEMYDVINPGGAGWTTNLAATEPPIYPSTVSSLGAIKLTANTNSFVFGTDGKLTLPVAGDIVDSNGNTVLGAGTANTGDVTFSGVKIIGAGTASGDGFGLGTLELVPDNNLYANNQYLVVDPTTPNHIHVRAGGTQDASQAQLFLGGEKNNVNVQDGNGVYINNQQTNGNTTYYNNGVEFTAATWFVDNTLNYIQFTTTDAMLLSTILNFSSTVPDTVEVTDGVNSYILSSSGYYGNLGNNEYRLGVVDTPPEGITLNLTALTFTIYTTNYNQLYLANNDFRVEVADDVRIIASDLFRLVNNSTGSGIEITTDDNNASHTWEFAADGNLTLPTTSQIIGDIVTVKGSSSVGIKVTSVLNPFDTKDWEFDSAGRMSFPDGTLQTTAYTGRNPLTTVAKTGGTASEGAATAIIVTNSPNPNWTNGTGVFANGINFIVAVDGSGNATVTTINDGGTGHFIGETFGPILGSAFGGTDVVDDMYFQVTEVDLTTTTELDLTKSVQKLTDGYYTLADGVEGQIMYLVRQAGTTAANIYLNIANGRVNSASYTDILLNPFISNSQGDMTTLLFTDGAWQSNNGQWD